jgi:hypothetical protein
MRARSTHRRAIAHDVEGGGDRDGSEQLRGVGILCNRAVGAARAVANRSRVEANRRRADARDNCGT